MSLGLRVVTLGVIGVLVAGLAQAGWFGLLLVDPLSGTAPGAAWTSWMPMVVQGALTLVLAAAVGWQIRRSLQPLPRSLALLQQQVDALEQGRFVIVEDPPLAAAVPLARSLNAAVRRMQSALDGSGPSLGAQALRRTARTDPDTGLDSRYTFLRHLTERLSHRSEPECAVLLLRLLPPPTCGQGEPAASAAQGLGDLSELLRVYAKQVQGAFVGRLGDNDFGLCLPAHGVIAETAASLVAAVSAASRPLRCAVGGADHLSGVSLGSALALLDMAAARAESLGPGRIECRSARNGGPPEAIDAQGRRAMVDALREGRVALGAYPVLDRHGHVLHLECPLRVQVRPGAEFEAAARWMPVALRYRLMTQIDLAGLELALSACQADGQARCIHVAAESLATAGFVSAVRSRLEAAPEAAARLWIEIAEVSFERLPPRLRNAGTVWRRCGARVGIEHAGAALRGLVRLGELDLDYVKLDASFVQGLAADAEQRQRVRGLVALVQEMGARVIAEGADDEADLAALWDLGFDGATGLAATRQHDSVATDQAMSPM
ncbi:MAG: EAL domain-containing protein [Rubrivivax sp.]|nr:EAL domain-containing protein [Rubrivivax sp.]